jgi:hypothetical protein
MEVSSEREARRARMHTATQTKRYTSALTIPMNHQYASFLSKTVIPSGAKVHLQG